MVKKFCFFFILSPLLSLSACWNPHVNVSPSGDSSNIDGPVLDVNVYNNGISVWTNTASSNQQVIRSSVYTNRHGWEPAMTISDISLNPFDNPRYINQADPVVSLNSFNYAVASWEGSIFVDGPDTYVRGIFSAFKTPAGIWSPVEVISTTNTNDSMLSPENPFIDVSDSGLAVAVWAEQREAGRFIMANFLPYGGTWGSPVQLANPANGFGDDIPMVQINSDNHAVAVWKADSAISGKEIGSATYNSSTGLWTTVILDPASTDTSLPKVGIDQSGNAIAVWIRQMGNFPDINYEFVSSSFNFNTQSWGPKKVIAAGISDIDPIGLSSGYIVVDFFGNATVVWEQLNDAIWEVRSSRFSVESSEWSPTEVISDPRASFFVGSDGVAQSPISVDLQGNVMVFGLTENNELQSITRFMSSGWQQPEIIALAANTLAREIRCGSCGFALAQWQNADEKTGLASENSGIFLAPSNLSVSYCCQKFASQKRCLNIITWDPSPSCILYYQIYRNGVLIGAVPGNVTSFNDPLRRSRLKGFQYTVVAINANGTASEGISVNSSSQ